MQREESDHEPRERYMREGNNGVKKRIMFSTTEDGIKNSIGV